MSKKDKKGNNYQWIFIGIVLLIYVLIYLFDPGKVESSMVMTFNLLYNIFLILLVVFIFMGLSNYFLSPSIISKYVGKGSGLKGWFIAVVSGILSHGPIYAWFPLLRDMKSHGMRDGLVAAFLYNRSVKIPLLPVMIFYFGWVFVIVLMILIMIASVIEGKSIEVLKGVETDTNKNI